jgi:peptidoglycan/LPS O-acetylase OafA/YrhL
MVPRAFRLDINGLRAWAVMAVVLYHFGMPWLPGGFAGVDVFFVISGFLMAGIIQTGLQRREFSLCISTWRVRGASCLLWLWSVCACCCWVGST